MQWLFTDARLGDQLLSIAAKLPPGSGIIVRHDHLRSGVRWRLLRRLMRIARARKLIVMLADTPAIAARWGAHGVHLRHRHTALAKQAQRLGLYLTMPVHNEREADTAARLRADLVFVSPLFPTRSHQDVDALGHKRFAQLARRCAAPVVALGGMTATRSRAHRLKSVQSGFIPGWAAIDAWLETGRKRQSSQKRN